VTVDTARTAHADAHLVPARVVESRLAAFHTGRNTLGAVFNRVGGVGGTEESVNAHHVAGAGRAAAKLADTGQV
jgi:hypothetical protein